MLGGVRFEGDPSPSTGFKREPREGREGATVAVAYLDRKGLGLDHHGGRTLGSIHFHGRPQKLLQ